MASGTATGGRRDRRWSAVIRGGAASLLLLPAIGMLVSDEVHWDGADFILVGAMLAAAAGVLEAAVRMTGSVAYRIAAGVAVTAFFLLILVNLAVGFLGSEDNPANLMFAGVLAVAVAGALLARFRPAGMARAMVATAAAQLVVGVTGLALGLVSPGPSGVYEVVMGTGLFGALWLLSAWLFRSASAAGG